MQSAEKNMNRYAVEESHLYLQEAFDLFSQKPDKSKEEKGLLIDLLNKWAHVFYYRGDIKRLTELLSAHQHMAESLDDKTRLGTFYVWLGFALWLSAKYRDSYQFLNKALKLGEETGNQDIIGYACNWLTFTCLSLGHLDEGIIFGERAVEIARRIPSDQFLYLKPLSGLGFIYGFKGEAKRALKIGNELLDYGQRKSNVRSLVMGHVVSGLAHVADGDFPSAVECGRNGVRVSADPFYSHVARVFLGLFYTNNGEFQEAKDILNKVVAFCDKYGDKNNKICLADLCLGPCLINSGQMGRGLKILEEGRRICLESGAGTLFFENMLGKVYLQIAVGASPIALSTMAKNIGFLAKNVPFASKKAETHLQKAIEISKEIGAKGTVGSAYLDMGVLHKAKGRKDKARACLNEAARIFEELKVKGHLRQTQEILSSLS
jgi:tetratricopeptide (TPR) repeat protein